MATDVAEFAGAALGLNLLFGIALLPAELITFAILGLQARGYRRFEPAPYDRLATPMRWLLPRPGRRPSLTDSRCGRNRPR